MKVDQLDRMAKKEPEKYVFNRVIAISTVVPDIFQQTIKKTNLETFWSNYRLSISTALNANFVVG